MPRHEVMIVHKVGEMPIQIADHLDIVSLVYAFAKLAYLNRGVVVVDSDRLQLLLIDCILDQSSFHLSNSLGSKFILEKLN